MRNIFKRYSKVLFGLGVILVLVLQIHNLTEYPLYKSFDDGGHLEYLDFLTINKKLPLANQGWELYQPPLYYLLLTILGGKGAVKPLSFLVWISFGFLIYRALKILQEKNKMLVILVYSLPVFIYSSLQVGNEFFSAFMISCSLFYYIKNQNKLIKNLKTQIILGVLLGLSILSKATAWVLVFSITLHMLFILSGKFKEKILSLLKILFVLIMIGGWFYVRNWLVLGNPFATSVDYPQYFINQAPGYRDLKFFTTLKGFLTLDLYKSHWYSFWSGLYYSWFYDAHNAVLPILAFSKIGVVIVLFSAPLLVVSMMGLFKLIKNKSLSILPIYSVLLLASLIFYNIKLPFYSTVKSMFLLSLIIPYIFGLSVGIKKLKIGKILINIYIFLLLILVMKHFWVDKIWYAHYISFLV